MQSSLLAVSSHSNINHATAKPKPSPPRLQLSPLSSPFMRSASDRFMTPRRLNALPRESQALWATLERFQPNALEEEQFQPEILKKYPVIGAVHKNLKQNSKAMRELLTQWLNGQPVDAKALERLEKRLSVMPAANGWDRLSQKLALFRPISSWEDVAHNARTLVGVPGAMVWTASQTVKYLNTPESEWKANPENSLKAQILAHNRYLQFPEVHEASVAYWALTDWRSELQQRLQLLKSMVSSQTENGKTSASD